MADENQEYAGVGQGNAGEAQQMPEVIPESAEQPESKESVDRRQAAISTRRRPFGPPLVESEAESAAESLPNEPETDCAPPGPDKSA